MSNNYQKRIDNFISHANEKPIEINRFKCTDYDHFQFRVAYDIQKDMKFKNQNEQRTNKHTTDHYRTESDYESS